ncbi:MAG TPA: alpha-ketoglutarate-dependent dioxygenase AlkB [Thermoanaerobaculia bacterium]|nr:alpha-ketoglutarate-dependent dioxygenase AlkB [Thermoanaerobaculia bacterium]
MLTAIPAGLTYTPDFLTADEERALLAEIETYPFHEVRMRGQVARRTVIHFGWDYDYEGWKVHPTTPPPPSLRALADRCAELAGIAPESLEQFLVARYPPGATIGWHRDAPMFGSPVIGVSLGSACRMKFRRKEGDGFAQFTQLLEPRSVYVLAGAARTQWQHSIPPTKELRYSISMRTLRRRTAS